VFRLSPRISVTDEALFRGTETPSPQKYGPIDLNRIKTRSPTFLEKSKIVRFQPLKQSAEPGPATYSIRRSERTPGYKMSKTKRMTYLDRVIAAHAFVPDPTKYNIVKADKFIT
jgi:hypothetical protein